MTTARPHQYQGEPLTRNTFTTNSGLMGLCLDSLDTKGAPWFCEDPDLVGGWRRVCDQSPS